MTMTICCAVAALFPVLGSGAAEHVGVTAAFKASSKPGTPGAIVVTLAPLNPAIRVNEEPAPRLKLDPDQRTLVDKQPPAPTRLASFDPETARYLDPKAPVSFPVAWAPAAPKGPQTVKGTVTYFYCSKTEGWCRKGTAEVEVALTVPIVQAP